VVFWNQASITNGFRDIQRRDIATPDLDATSKQRSRSFIVVPIDFSYITIHSETPIFCIVSNWINGTYNTIHSRHSIDTPHTVWSAIDRTVEWARVRPRRKSIAST